LDVKLLNIALAPLLAKNLVSLSCLAKVSYKLTLDHNGGLITHSKTSNILLTTKHHNGMLVVPLHVHHVMEQASSTMGKLSLRLLHCRFGHIRRD
jgi:hypothetical protein